MSTETMKQHEVYIKDKVNINKRVYINRKVTITSGFLLLLIAVTVLAGPERTVILLAAAGVHELGHILALRAFGAGIDRFSLSGAGAEIVFTRGLSYPGEIAAALSGPFAGALLAALALWAGRRWGNVWLLELTAVSALYTAANLVPVSVADGGRALDAALCWRLGPGEAYYIGLCLDFVCVAGAFAAGTVLFVRTKGNPALLLYAFFLLNGCCKKRGFGVQSK